jgi:hypothetical protein
MIYESVMKPKTLENIKYKVAAPQSNNIVYFFDYLIY